MKKLSLIITILSIIQIGINAQPCLPNGITFSQQSEIDNFQNNYPNCSEIDGDVIIEASFGHHIYNLTGLSGIESIVGNLFISGNYDLTNLSGLDNLTSIDGILKVNGNSSLQNLSGLDNLTNVGKDILIYSNDITNLIGLGEIEVVNGNLEIIQNYYLISLEGLNNVNEITGDLLIWSNYVLEDIADLESINYIGGSLTIDYNVDLINLAGLENIDTIHGDLTIHENFNLINLDGLNNLTYIDGNLDIYDCLDLQDLTALNKLNSINGDLIIRFSATLESLSGLDSIDATTINNLIIKDNNLSMCSVKSICDYISNPTGVATIESNRNGCNSVTEVNEACITFDSEKMNNPIVIIPNPATNEIWIQNCSSGAFLIYSLSGQKIFEGNLKNEKIDISMIPEGIYIYEIQSDRISHQNKLVITR